MIEDHALGVRDGRGDWRPAQPIEYPPVFVWPPRPSAFVRWLIGYPGYILPWNAFYLALAVALWFWLTPPLSAFESPDLLAIGLLLGRNLLIAAAFYGAFHLRLYVRRSQGEAFKYDARWPEEKNESFLFGSQTKDNLFRTLASGVPVWTAYEALMLWAFANGHLPAVEWHTSPIYFVALLLVLPIYREVHFYLVHRLIHWEPLYRRIHRIHHKNINPGPWSGLAMHPVEHLLYFSCVLVHWVVPSHPIHIIFHLAETALSPAPAHVGFHRVVLGEKRALDTQCYAHYLHHKYFRCNYADGVVPLDRWFGTFHDGSPEGARALSGRAARTPGKAIAP